MKLLNIVSLCALFSLYGEENRVVIDPLGDGISCIELINVSGDDLGIVNAARVSYGKVTKVLTGVEKKLIQYLVKHQHMTPFEHNILTFRVKAPIYVARQWFRHRIGVAYNETSYRYVQAPEQCYVPAIFRVQDTKNKQSSYGEIQDVTLTKLYTDATQAAFAAYEKLIAAGVAREQSRGVLPLCTYTEFIFTCNLRSLMHFIGLRLDPHAQYEIQVFAKAMLDLAAPHFPVAIEAFRSEHQGS